MKLTLKILGFLLLLFCLSFFSACNINIDVDSVPAPVQTMTPEITSTPSPSPTPTATPTPTPTPVPTPTPRSGPTVIGIYGTGSGGRVLLTEYSKKWVRGEDIAEFKTFASNEEVLAYAPFRDMLVDCWFSFPDAASYKIGYELSYTLVSGEEISITITKPSDITYTEYLEVYLYDSVQQYKHGGWYTHLSDDDMDEETLLYSFKLTPGVKIKEVETIKLKNFVYKYMDKSDFDPESGKYIGTVWYEIDIVEP